MTRNFVRRAGVFAATMACALALAATPAMANQDSEHYVGVNAQGAIAALSSAGTPAERTAKFGALMEQFADVGEISSKVLGVYARQLRADPTLKKQWTEAFRDYAMATYEDQLDRYRGSDVTVVGSRDADQNGKPCSRVTTQITETKGAKPVTVFWYLCKAAPAASWRVSDVGLDVGGGEIKLLLSQRAQFESVLGRNGGDIPALIKQVKSTTASMRARIDAKKR
ncbi:MAG TPA: ABC transporter substrate-binding protein [Caulobacterales bacterium]|jgi:phospholipid transport system substrate-binding protein|nr:ABC transporter substrate-binding protein [Caulobacterales bacterium]